MRCKEQVGEPPGYWHFHTCGRPAKWVVTDLVTDPDSILHKVRKVCGIHVRYYRKHPQRFQVEQLSEEVKE
jgi:hypothetical protein